MAKSKWVVYEYGDLVEPCERRPGCYVIYGDGKLLYIGQSINVRNRIKTYDIHYARDFKICFTLKGRDLKFNTFAIKVCYSKKVGDWAMQEIRLINRLKPEYNCTHGGRSLRAARNSRPQANVIYLQEPSEYDLMMDIMLERDLEEQKRDDRIYQKMLRGLQQ